jgi:EPS-associated MarR family transcriptional regulator
MVERVPPAREVSDEVRYRILKYISENPNASQRQLARELGVSVGKVNYCLRALIGKGLLKMRNFQNNQDKSAYLYVLTPKGIEEKIKVTYDFLRRKISEYDLLSKEIELLSAEVRGLDRQGLSKANGKGSSR